jgi:sugar phosphate isomerase/epimerase
MLRNEWFCWVLMDKRTELLLVQETDPKCIGYVLCTNHAFVMNTSEVRLNISQ